MKRTLSLFVCVVLCLATLVSCGKPYNYDLSKYVTLGQYKGVTVSKSEIEEQIDEQYSAVLSASAEYVETNAVSKEGDKITYSYTGTIDGAANDALTGENKTLTAVSGTTGFKELDEALVGIKGGSNLTVDVVLPENFSADASLAGKTATLAVTVAKVEELVTPETLTDEMVKTYTEETYTTIDAYRTYLYSAIKQNLAWSAAVKNCSFTDYPKKEAENYYNTLLTRYQAQASQYGMTLEQFTSLTGYTMDAFQAALAQQAVNQTRQDVVMYSIARAEGLEPDQARIDAEAASLAKENGFATVKEMYAQLGEDQVLSYVQSLLVMEFLEANAVEAE
ncbi:MAG: hypothetical protein MJ175_04105 [Clostridia bacterium]|nr:hypothetical protein [Clostridia bacterium]